MDSKWLSPLILHITLLVSIWCCSHVNGRTNIIDVNNYSAITSQKADSNEDFENAWKKACGTSGGVFTVAEGTHTVSGSLQFQGPCNGRTTVTINGVLKADSQVKLSTDYWILFSGVNDLIINGKGTLDGNGAVAWGKGQNSPTTLKIEKATKVQIQDIKSLNSKMFHIKVHESQHVTLNHVTISAPANSANTDGVHVSESSDVAIINSQIATGDDCVSIGEGSSNVNVTGVSCGPGHGFSIGSLGKNQGEKDVSSITVTNCTLTGTTNGLRIKTFASSVSMAAHDITFQHIVMNNVKNPILIDQQYCDKRVAGCTKGQGNSNVQIRGVKFNDVRGNTATQTAINFDCSATKQCQDIQLTGVNLKFNGQPTIAKCSNADAKFIGANQIPSKC